MSIPLGTITTPAGSLTQTGTAVTSFPNGGAISNGTGSIDPTTGTFTQSNTALIAGTTGTSVTPVTEYAVSDPVTVLIHVPPGVATGIATPGGGVSLTSVHGKSVHAKPVHAKVVHAKAVPHPKAVLHAKVVPHAKGK